eukprot:1624506-Ditylum_brightwellii.AAC.1
MQLQQDPQENDDKSLSSNASELTSEFESEDYYTDSSNTKIAYKHTHIDPNTKNIKLFAKYTGTDSSSCEQVAIPDSGCNATMSSVEEFFEYIVPLQKRGDQATYAILGENKTSLRVLGYGYINVLLDGHRVRHMAYYVPGLGTALLS